MNRKQLTLILAAVVVIGGLGLWFRHLQNKGYQSSAGRMGNKVLAPFDLNAVAGVRVVTGTNVLDLAREEGRWIVRQRGGYPANFANVSEFVRQVWELKTTQTVQAGESQLGRLELLPPDSSNGAGTLVELRDREGQTIASLLLGKKHLRRPAAPGPMGGDEGWPDGRYVMVPGRLETLSLVSETFSNIEPRPEQWLNKDFFRVERIRSVTVTWPDPEDSWTLRRETETGPMQFDNPRPDERPDTSRLSSIASALGFPSFNDVIPDPDPEETGLANPITIEIQTFDDFTYRLQVGRPATGDDYHLAVAVTANVPTQRTPGEDESDEDKERLDREFQEKADKLKEKLAKEQALAPWTFRVSKWTLDTVLKKRGELLLAPSDDDPLAVDPDDAFDRSPALFDPSSIVPSLEPLPPPPVPRSATDVIQPLEAPPIETTLPSPVDVPLPEPVVEPADPPAAEAPEDR